VSPEHETHGAGSGGGDGIEPLGKGMA